MSIIGQWQSEAEESAKEGTMKIQLYYGAGKALNLQAQCCGHNAASAPDIVITSYGVILSEWQQFMQNNGNYTDVTGIFGIEFFRVVIDEGHNIKNRLSKTAKACYQIKASRRWVLTGECPYTCETDIY